MKCSCTFLLYFLCTKTVQVRAAQRIPLLPRAAQDPPAILGSVNCSSTGNIWQFALIPPKASSYSTVVTASNLPQLKNANTLKSFCELLMEALQLIYVKESWATDESGSNKMIYKRPHSKQQGLRASSIVLVFTSTKKQFQCTKYIISPSPNLNKGTSKSSFLSYIAAA